MFNVYQFFPNYEGSIINNIPSANNVWILVGKFSQLIDAQNQLNIFKQNGVDANYLRQLTDADPAPNDIPIA